jgi:hypothetical protein
MDSVMKGNFHKDVNMEKGYINGRMEIHMKGSLNRINGKDLEFIFGLIKEFIGDSGKKIE